MLGTPVKNSRQKSAAILEFWVTNFKKEIAFINFYKIERKSKAAVKLEELLKSTATDSKKWFLNFAFSGCDF